jgi:hypothetical protein
MGRHWVHAALAVTSRFLIDLRLGPRTLELAAELMASVAMACRQGFSLPLILIDDHLPYPAAILQVFGVIRHRRRKRGRGRLKHPDLKPPPGLMAGRTPAMALGLTAAVWTVNQYVEYPVHVSDLERQIWAEERQTLLTSALDARKRKKLLPTS